MASAFRAWPLAAAVLVSLACGGGGGAGGGGGNGNPTGPTPGPSVPSSASVSMSSSTDGYGYETNTFSPTSVTVARNGTVTWVNTSGVSHNVTFSTPGAPANIPNHVTGTNARTFASTGTFSYQCGNHAGMNGAVTVQ